MLPSIKKIDQLLQRHLAATGVVLQPLQVLRKMKTQRTLQSCCRRVLWWMRMANLSLPRTRQSPRA
jgi:hypothetical protein